ncbi:MAG: hypothetical protein IPL61_17935 [Myxococcales bacterium]|nr:hypothetical protein [Myxococcales bacterium]
MLSPRACVWRSGLLIAATACGGGPDAIDAGGDATTVDGAALDAPSADAATPDAALLDAPVADAVADAALLDAPTTDATTPDAALLDAPPTDATAPDAALLDAPTTDAPTTDAASIDAATTDAPVTDAAPLDASAPPCSNGPGRTVWRLSWPSGQGGYARVDAWAAACAYSLADAACSLSGEPHNYASFGPGVVFNSSTDYFRVRFSVAGLSFTTATLYLSAHADGGGLPRLAVQSQLHGEYLFQPTVPISTHRLYAIDWSSYLAPTDAPSLTAVTLRPMPVGVAVSQLELCVQ